MATLIKSVDKQRVKFTDTFTYTIDAAFSCIEGSIENARVEDFIPSNIEYTLPKVVEPIKNITVEKIEEGDLITFDFGNITDTDISISINLACKFKLGTESLTRFDNEIDMWINGQLSETAICDTVTLDVVEDFVVEKEIVTPKDAQSSRGGSVVFTITLKNQLTSEGGSGDLGAKVSNINITDILPKGLSLNPNYDIVGKDISPRDYSDKRYDGKTATVEENVITFSLEEYYGTKYQIVMVCSVDETIELGSEIQNTINLDIEDIERNSATVSLLIGEKTYGANIDKNGPISGSVENYISYNLNIENTKNQDLVNFIVEDKIPQEVTAYRINTGSLKLDVINELIDKNYEISYELNNSTQYILLGTYNTKNAQFVDLPIIGLNDKITKIRWTIPNLLVGTVQDKSMTIDGVINSTNIDNKIISTGEAMWNDETKPVIKQSTVSTDLNGKSVLNSTKSVINNTYNVVPGDIIRYSIKFNANKSQIDDLVVSDLLVDEVTYIGNEKYILYDYFEGITINSITTPSFFDIVPIQKQIIENFNSTGMTLIRYKLEDFSLRQRGNFTIEYDARVNIGATRNISNDDIDLKCLDQSSVEEGLVPSNSSDVKTSISGVTCMDSNENEKITDTDTDTDTDAGVAKEPKVILMLLSLIENEIYSLNCETSNDVVICINRIKDILIEIVYVWIRQLNKVLNDREIKDSGYKAQVQRLIYVGNNIALKLKSIEIPKGYCNIDILSNLISVILEISLKMIEVEETNKGIITYYSRCGCIGSNSYQLLVGKLVNGITCLNSISNTLSDISSIIYSQLTINNKPYVAIHSPKPQLRGPIQCNNLSFVCPPNEACVPPNKYNPKNQYCNR